MGRLTRTWILSMLIGFHNAWEQDDAELADLGIRIQSFSPGYSAFGPIDPARCFFWGQSSLLN